jgi:NADH:ubiquinone oxidoreductase subunit 6 (subunit J)
MTPIFSVFFGSIIVIAVFALWYTKNLLHSALYLLLTFLSVASIFVLLGADFLAVVQIVVYVGGVLVLLIFGIFLTQSNEGKDLESEIHKHKRGSIMLVILVFASLTRAINQTNWEKLPWIKSALKNNLEIKQSTIHHLGVRLMTDYLLAFELIGILLLLVLIGASFIAGNQNKENYS